MAIPTTGHLDSTLAFVREGYRFASNRCDELGTDIFETRLLLEPTILMRGPKLTELFYDTDKFTRVNAAPERVLDTLFGKGGVQGLDGNAHEHRKAMFMSILGRESLPRLVTTVERHWYQHVERWEKQDQIVLHRALQELLVTAACEWLGIPLADDELAQRTDDVTAMIDGAGGVAARYLRARLGRRRSERWIGDVIRMARAGAHDIDEGSGVHVVAEHRDPNGELLASTWPPSRSSTCCDRWSPSHGSARSPRMPFTSTRAARRDSTMQPTASASSRRCDASTPSSPWSRRASDGASCTTADSSMPDSGSCSTSTAPIITEQRGTTPIAFDQSDSKVGPRIRSCPSRRVEGAFCTTTVAQAST